MDTLSLMRATYQKALASDDPATALADGLGVSGPDADALSAGKAFKASKSLPRRKGPGER